MRRPRIRALLALVALAVGTVVVASSTPASAAPPPEATPGYRLGIAVLFVEAVQVDAYLDALHEYFTAQLPPSRSRSTVSSSYNGVGECTGFSVPDYIIQRESGGSSTAHNASGAHGCTQTLLSHYSDGGSCAGLDPYTIDGQRACTAILSDNGTNLQPWAQTA